MLPIRSPQRRGCGVSTWRKRMPQPERFEVLVLGSGTGGKLVAWHMAKAGRRTAVAERRWIGGSCSNVACMPSKNEISSARVAYLVRHAASYGMKTGPAAIDMAVVLMKVLVDANDAAFSASP